LSLVTGLLTISGDCTYNRLAEPAPNEGRIHIMATFKDYDDLHSCMVRLYDESKRDSRIAPKIKDSNLVIQFRYDEPHATVTINAAAPPNQPGAYFDVAWGDVSG